MDISYIIKVEYFEVEKRRRIAAKGGGGLIGCRYHTLPWSCSSLFPPHVTRYNLYVSKAKRWSPVYRSVKCVNYV